MRFPKFPGHHPNSDSAKNKIFFCGLRNCNSENADLEISESLFKGKGGGGGLTGEGEQRLRGSFVGKFGDCRMIRTMSPMEDREKSVHTWSGYVEKKSPTIS